MVEEGSLVAGSSHASSTELGSIRCCRTRVRDPRARRLTAGLVLTLGLVLGACSVPFGPGGEDSPGVSDQTPRERNQLYQEEQQRMYRQNQLDRSGPSDR